MLEGSGTGWAGERRGAGAGCGAAAVQGEQDGEERRKMGAFEFTEMFLFVLGCDEMFTKPRLFVRTHSCTRLRVLGGGAV